VTPFPPLSALATRTELPLDSTETISSRTVGTKELDEVFWSTVVRSVVPAPKTTALLTVAIEPVASTAVRRAMVMVSALLGVVTNLPMRPLVIERTR
jgi:hypothetical protein